MSCNIQTKTLNYLKEKELINNSRVIPSEKLEEFKAMNSLLTEKARNEKEVDLGLLFTIEEKTIERGPKKSSQFVMRAIPNTEAFEAIQDFNDNIPQAKNIYDLVKEGREFFSPREVKTEKKTSDNKEYYEQVSLAMFNGTPKNTTTQEVLSNLAQSNIIKDPTLNDLLLKLAVQSNTDVKIISGNNMPNKDTLMYFESKGTNKTIYIAGDKLGNNTPEVTTAKFLHEVFHERTYRVLNAPKSEMERFLVSNINKIYNAANNYLDTEQYKHELSNLDEFTAAMFDNKEFADKVNELTLNSWWDNLISFFRNLFNVQKPQLLDNILKLIDIQEASSDILDLTRESKDPSYRSIEDDFEVKKLQKTADRISNLLETFFNISSRTASTYNQNVGNIITNLSQLKEKYGENEDAYSALAVAKYMKFMANQMRSFNKRLSNPKTEFTAELYSHMENYLSAFGIINNIKDLMNDLKSQGVIDEKTFNKYNNTIVEVMSLFNNNKALLNNKAKNYLIDNFASTQYFKEEYLRFQDSYKAKARELYPGKENAAKRNSYVNNELAKNRELIAERTKQRFRKLIENSKEDISRAASQINSEKALNNPIVQILSRVLDKNELEYKNEILPLFRELQEAEKKFSEGRPKNESLKKRNEKFTERGRDGYMYLKGQYSIEFVNTLQEKKEDIAKALEEFGPLSEEYKNAILERKRWLKSNTVKLARRRYVPSNKWLNDFSKFTEKERDYHSALMHFTKESVENTGGVKSLKKTYYEADFYRMASIHKTTLSRFQEGELLDGLKNSVRDTFTKRIDDATSGEVSLEQDDLQKVYTDLSGKEISYVPLHFRGVIEEKDQSYDLSTVVALELENSIKFKHRNAIHADLNMFIDVLKESKYTKKVGFTGKTLTSLFSKEGITPVEINGEDANLLKLIDTMMKNRMYDKLSEYSGKIGEVDANKVISTLLGYTSHIGMALNYFGATANFAVGSVNNMIESFAGDIVTPKNIKNAIEMYSGNINGVMKDIGKPVSQGLVNQIIDKFNIMGEVRNLNHAFEKNNKFKALFSTDTFQFMHNIGEHGMQAVLTLAVLDNVKLLDKEGNYIDANGNIVTESKAVSLMEMYEVDTKGNLNVKKTLPKDFYTTIDNLNSFNEGGEANVRALVKQIIFRNHGQYDSRLQSEFQRHWYGKMMMMYKKHIEIPMLNRTRGLATSLKRREDLTSDQLKYNYDLNKIDEGHYTSMIRFLRHNVLPSLKSLKLQMIMIDYNSLDDWERANLRRTMAEVAVIGMFAATAQLIAAAAGDDNEALWFAAYTFRRVQSDLSQYHNPNEAWRILKNPFASLRQIETVTSILETVITPWSWDDVYEGGPYKGESVMKRRFIKMVPILTRKDLSAKQAYNFIAK